MNTQGRAGEEQAARFLTARGWRILEKNYAAPCGEIDLIALDGKTLVFVEVKARAYSAFGGPLAAVTPAKQRRIAQTAAFSFRVSPVCAAQKAAENRRGCADYF